MPYVSKRTQERARWMTLREALAHIEEAERCSLKAAWAQLGEAIADREVEARWRHGLMLTRMGDYDDKHIGPPRDIRFWKSARRIFVRGGTILDDPACRKNTVRLQLIREGKLHYRPVLIQRESVERIWPIAKGTPEPTASTVDLSSGAGLPNKSVGAQEPYRGSRSKESIRLVAREVYANPANDRPNVNEAWKLIRAKLPGVNRSRVMEVLAEDEFATQRKKPGNQPKS